MAPRATRNHDLVAATSRAASRSIRPRTSHHARLPRGWSRRPSFDDPSTRPCLRMPGAVASRGGTVVRVLGRFRGSEIVPLSRKVLIALNWCGPCAPTILLRADTLRRICVDAEPRPATEARAQHFGTALRGGEAETRADLAAGIALDYARVAHVSTMREEPYGHAPIAATGRAGAAEAAGRSRRSFTACGIARRAGAGRLCNSAAPADDLCCRNIGTGLRQQHEQQRQQQH